MEGEGSVVPPASVTESAGGVPGPADLSMIHLRKSIQTFVNNKERDTQALIEARAEVEVLRARLVLLQRGRGGREAILQNERKLRQTNELMEKKLEQARGAQMTVIAENGRLRDSINSLRKEAGQIAVVARALRDDAEATARDSAETDARVLELKDRVMETEAHRDGLHEEHRLETTSQERELRQLAELESRQVERRVRLEQEAATMFAQINASPAAAAKQPPSVAAALGRGASPTGGKRTMKSTRVGVGEAMLAAATEEAKSVPKLFNPADRPFSRQFQSMIRSGRTPSSAELRQQASTAVSVATANAIAAAAGLPPPPQAPPPSSRKARRGLGASESLPELPRPRGAAATLVKRPGGGGTQAKSPPPSVSHSHSSKPPLLPHASAHGHASDDHHGAAVRRDSQPGDSEVSKALVRQRWQLGFAGVRQSLKRAHVSGLREMFHRALAATGTADTREFCARFTEVRVCARSKIYECTGDPLLSPAPRRSARTTRCSSIVSRR